MLILAWGIAWQRLDAERQLLIAESTRQQENLAYIIAENLSQVLDRGKLLAVAAGKLAPNNGRGIGKSLADMRSIDPSILRITLFSAEAKQLYASTSQPMRPEIEQSIRRMAENSASRWTPEMQVMPHDDSPLHAWDIQLLFPVLDHDNMFRGVMLTVLDTGYFLGLYQKIDMGLSGIIRIIGSDGNTLAEAHRAGIALIDASNSRSPLPSVKEGDQIVSGMVIDQGAPHLTSYRKLNNYPLAISVSRNLGEIQSEYFKSRSRVLIMLGWFSFVLIAVTVWILSNFQRQSGLFRSMQHMNKNHRELIEQLEEEKNRVFKLAAHDHLTGLNNRRMFQEMVSSHLSRAKRSQHHYVLMFLDLDRFKSINDTLGHHVGDLLLQVVATRLRDCVRESDVVARLGGDEFAILLTGVDALSDAQHIAQKLIERIGQTCRNLDGHDVTVTPSIGISVFPRDGADFDTLCRSADSAMYQAKRAGRGRHVFYDLSLNRCDDRQFNLEQRLPDAINQNQLILHFQPKIRLSDHRIVGFEALVRWQHPEHGLIYPSDFIPLAEHTGIIHKLGEWVIAECCRQLAEWRSTGIELAPIAFNVSAKQLRDEGMAQIVTEALQAHSLSGSLLEAEITETALVESLDVAGNILESLTRQGLVIALDDFGNGFSNFEYVRSMPIHRIKIDRSFIKDIHKQGKNSAIVDAVVSLAHKLKMKVVAEGVETREQLMHLKTIDCDEIQGYFISRPVPGEAAGKLLAQRTLNPL